MSTFKPDANYDALSPQTTKGDLAVYGAAGSTRLVAGTDGLFLKADSTQTLGLAYASPAGANLGVTLSSVGITLTASTDVLIATNTGTDMVVTMPDLATNVGKVIQIYKQTGHGAGSTACASITGLTTTAKFFGLGLGASNVAGLTMSTTAESYRLLASNATTWVALQHQTSTSNVYTPTLGGVGSASAVSFMYARNGKYLSVEGTFTAGTVAASLIFITLPNPVLWRIDATYAPDQGHTATQTGFIVGELIANGANKFGHVVTATGTSTAIVYAGGDIVAGSTPLVPANGNALLANSSVCSVHFKVPIIGWDD